MKLASLGHLAAASFPQNDAACRSGASAIAKHEARNKGFYIEVEGARAPLSCGDVRGFREAAMAAIDPRLPMPQRLAIIAPDPAMRAWLETWAEDEGQVRRSLTILRRFDKKAILAIATLCSFGYGVETSFAIESLRPPRGYHGPEILRRSGVHLRVDVEALLAYYRAESRTEERVDPWWFE